MKLKTGHIYWFQYSAYKNDKNPLCLILYPGDKNTPVHALNLHYLPNNLNDQVINMIANVAGRRLKANDMKAFYHDFLKKKLHPAITRSYRTYIKTKVRTPVEISKGFKESLGYLYKFKSKISNKDLNKIKTKIKTQIHAEGTIENKLQYKDINPAQLQKAIENYVSAMNHSSKKIQDKKLLEKFTKKITKG